MKKTRKIDTHHKERLQNAAVFYLGVVIIVALLIYKYEWNAVAVMLFPLVTCSAYSAYALINGKQQSDMQAGSHRSLMGLVLNNIILGFLSLIIGFVIVVLS